MSGAVSDRARVDDIAKSIQRDPLTRINHVDLEVVFNHLRARVDRSLAEVGECVPVQMALRKLISAVAEAERQMDIREAEIEAADAKRSVREYQQRAKAAEQRLAELSGEAL